MKKVKTYLLKKQLVNAAELLAGLASLRSLLPQRAALKIKKPSLEILLGLPSVIPQSSALKIVQTKKRSSKLGVFSN
jgi:hypothetical protein